MSKINDPNNGSMANSENASEHQKELLDHYADALEEKQEDSLKGTPKEAQSQEAKKKQKKKRLKSSDDKVEVSEDENIDAQDDLKRRKDQPISDEHPENADDGAEYDEEGFKLINGMRTGFRLPKKTRRKKLSEQMDDDSNESTKRKKRSRKGAKSSSSLEGEVDSDGHDVDIGFGSNSDDDNEDDSDDKSQLMDISYKESMPQKTEHNTHIMGLSDNKKAYINFLNEFAHDIDTLNEFDYMQRKTMAQDIIMQMFRQFIEGMEEFPKETREHRRFGMGARLTQEILRALKVDQKITISDLLKKLTLQTKNKG